MDRTRVRRPPARRQPTAWALARVILPLTALAGLLAATSPAAGIATAQNGTNEAPLDQTSVDESASASPARGENATLLVAIPGMLALVGVALIIVDRRRKKE